MDIAERIEKKELKGYLTVNKRIIAEDYIYHITQRAPGRELLFLEDPDRLYFLKLLKETAKKFNLELFCFALLDNHVHLFLRIKEKNLSQAMKSLFERYAGYFNNKYKRKGHVFCGRYRASLCNDENYLLAASLYIHLNPYNAGLCEDFRDYRWSSILLYTENTGDSFINPEEILLLLDSQLDKAKEQYLNLLEEAAKVKRPDSRHLSLAEKAIKGMAMAIKQGWKIPAESLDSKIAAFKAKKRVSGTEDRKVVKYIIEQLKANGHSISEILEILGISRAKYYRIIGEVRQTSLT